MDRKKFLKNLGIGALTLPVAGTIFASQTHHKDSTTKNENSDDCVISPRETAGPFL